VEPHPANLDYIAGPSNQRRDLRYLMALAKELDAGIIPVGVYKHFLDRMVGEKTTVEALQESNQKQRQQAAAGGNVRFALRASQAPDTDQERPARAVLTATVGGGSGSSVAQQPHHMASWQDDEPTTPEGVPYCLGSRRQQYMPPDKLFDMEPVAQFIPVATVEELKAQGWDGTIGE
jgi:hypothetical protein